MYSHFLKRFFDITGALFMLLLGSWLFVLIIIVYILTRQYPLFFKQDRIGRNEKIFRIIKFRTLKHSGVSLEDRRFWWGDILRVTSLDELPQLFNVLLGDMSLIGPRPLPVEYLPLFSEEHRQRHVIRPGVTGWAQINGRNSIPWQKKFELDLYYVKNLSFRLDFRIVIKTILLILSFRKDTSLEEQKFTGE